MPTFSQYLRDYGFSKNYIKENLKMKKLVGLNIVLLIALLLAACGGGATGGGDEGPFKVAVVMPSPINDLAFSQSMYDALVALQNEMGEENFEIAYSDSMFVVDDAAAALRDYASQGYDLIIAHGSQYGASLQEIAAAGGISGRAPRHDGHRRG